MSHRNAPSASVTGVLMAGGRGERLGEDKLLAPLAGRPMGLRVAEALAGATEPLLVSVEGSGGAARIGRAGGVLATIGPERIVLDAPGGPGGATDPAVGKSPGGGPLAGLAAAVAAAPTDAVFVAACDYPFLTPAAIRRIIAALGSHDAAIPDIDGWLHPLCACYSRRIAGRLDAAVAEGRRGVTRFALTLDFVRLRERDFRDAGGTEAFMNVNTPAERRLAERRMRATAPAGRGRAPGAGAWPG